MDRLEGDARVLLQRRRRPDREPRAQRAGAYCAAQRQDRRYSGGGYHGEYIREIAERYVAAHKEDPAGKNLDTVRRFAVDALREEQDRDLQAFGVRFDVYALESALYTSGKVDETERAPGCRGHTYEKDGARWLRTTDFGDDKDRVMRKSAEKGGDYTYFVPDVAYHVTKWERGFSRAINVQGADHHGPCGACAWGCRRWRWGFPRGIRSTCCIKW